MTVRSEGQFNTVVYEDYDLYRGIDRRDVILLHPEDLKRLGIEPEARVEATSETGTLSNIIARSYDKIRPGNALMYYPEANVLVPRHLDPASRTPAFKNVLITVRTMALVNGAQGRPGGYGGVYTPAEPVASTRAGMRAC
jgi:anaerobic selenocysteine-containing dehydrogenase